MELSTSRTVQPVKAGIIEPVLGGVKSCVLQRLDSDLSDADLLISCALLYDACSHFSFGVQVSSLCGRGIVRTGLLIQVS